jgi:hypothetical protein
VAAEETAMSYIQRVLQPGEQIRHTASIHWIVYWPGVVMLIVAAVLWWYGIYRPAWATPLMATLFDYLALIVALIGLVLLFREWFIWWTTEIAVTDRRVVYKQGFIWRHTNEMLMEKVESVKVYQPILGRILDYGDVTVLGTGEGFETLRTISAPLDLRNHITGR